MWARLGQLAAESFIVIPGELVVSESSDSDLTRQGTQK